jgi:hypothetical protein
VTADSALHGSALRDSTSALGRAPGPFATALHRALAVQGLALPPIAPPLAGKLLAHVDRLAEAPAPRSSRTLVRLLARMCRMRAYAESEDAFDAFDAFGTALLIALRETLGVRFDEATEAAWGSLYGELVETMCAGRIAPDRSPDG